MTTTMQELASHPALEELRERSKLTDEVGVAQARLADPKCDWEETIRLRGFLAGVNAVFQAIEFAASLEKYPVPGRKDAAKKVKLADFGGWQGLQRARMRTQMRENANGG